MARDNTKTERRQKIPLTRPKVAGKEMEYIASVLARGHFSGDGPFTRKCHAWLESRSGSEKALLTHSCTAALEMAALLLDVGPGDEVIMPSYTFVSTANAFVLRGATPVFVDIRPDTLNIDETLVEAAVTPWTRAIVPVHYAGVACEMNAITEIAEKNGLTVVEDAAQGLGSTYRGRPLGSIGTLAAYSFHETKNVISGEGGALLVNGSPELSYRAEIIREKGTDRTDFFRGNVDKYTWRDVGSSYLPSELVAAFLYAQFESANEINRHRIEAWQYYHGALEDAERQGVLSRPVIPEECLHNGHLYYILVRDPADRARVIKSLHGNGIQAAYHYVPLHSSPAGQKYGRTFRHLKHTDDISSRLVRLPLSASIEPSTQAFVVEKLVQCLFAK